MSISKTIVSAYCRVSTDSDDQLNSLDYQTSYFTDYISKRDDYELYKVFADEGLSGTSWDKRVQFKHMLYDAGLDILEYKGELLLRDSDRLPKFTRILVKDVSRWARDVGALDVLKRLKLRGVFVDFITANLTTESMSDDILVGLMMLLAESDSKDKSTKIIFGHEQGAKRGRILTADNFYGYKYIKETNDLEIIEEEAEVVRKIYDLYLEGNGYLNIIYKLTELGYFTRKGKPFVQTTIRRILSNRAYKGDLIRNKLDAPRVFSNRKSSKLRDESEWIVHKGRIPAIVSEETFDEVQSLMKIKSKDFSHRAPSINSIYTGKVYCNNCGNTYILNQESVSKGAAKFYVCKTKKRQSVKVCNAPNIKKVTLDEAYSKLNTESSANWLKKYIEEIAGIIYVETIPRLRSKLDRNVEEELMHKKATLDKLQDEKRRLTYLYVKGNIEEDVLTELSNENTTNINRLSAEILELSRTNEDIQNEIDEVLENVELLKKAAAELDPYQFVNKIIVKSSTSVVIEMNFLDVIKQKLDGRSLPHFEFLNDYTAAKLIEV